MLPSPRRFSLLMLLVAAVFLGIELGDYFLGEITDVQSIGRKPTLVGEFGEGAAITQTFSIAHDGLRSVAIPISSDEPASLAFEFVLLRVTPGRRSDEVVTRLVDVSQPAGVTWHTIEFPAISLSKDHTFIARFQLTRAESLRRGSNGPSAPRPTIALMAWADNALPTGALSIANEERWGDLAFSAQADPPTRLQRMVGALDTVLPRALGLNRTVTLLLAAVYALLILGVMIVALTQGVSTWQPGAERPQKAPTDGRPWARALGVVVLGVATPALFVGILAARERVAVDLLDDLDAAVLESPMGMHGGFSVIQEIINGDSPPALFAHPPSRVTWTVLVPRSRPLLKISAALRAAVWEQRSDGVTFAIAVEEGAGVTPLASRFVNPGTTLEDRAWVAMDVDLSPYAGRTVRIVLTTSPGPSGDSAWDWAMWGHPRIIERR